MTYLHEKIESDEYWADSRRLPRISLLPYAETIANNAWSSFGIGNSPLKRVRRLIERSAEEGYEYRQAEDGQQLGSMLDNESLLRIVEDTRQEIDWFGRFTFGKKQSSPELFESKGIEMLAKTLYAGRLVRRLAERENGRPYLLERKVSYLLPGTLGGIATGSVSFEVFMPSNVATGVYLPSAAEVGIPYDRSKGKNSDNLKIVKAGVILPTPKNKFRIGKLVKQT